MVAELARNTSAFAGVLEAREQGTGNDVFIADTVLDHAALSLAVLDRIATSSSRNVDQEDLLREMAIAITGDHRSFVGLR
jgi:hypothetical protein